MWTFAQLEQLPSQNLQTRARDLKDVLSKQAVVPEDFIKACRGPNGESIVYAPPKALVSVP
jgi:hypothetical protein